MTKVISTSSSVGITLTASDNPVTITSSGTIDTATGSYALLGPSGSYTIINYGLVRDTAATGVGIGLLGGGAVTNSAATAQIVGTTYGIEVSGATGVVNNYGTIHATGGTGAKYARVVALGAGGSVSNESHGVISGGNHAIGISAAAAATIINAGTITAGLGITLQAGGSVANSSIIRSSYDGAIYAGSSASITNSGNIEGYDKGIWLQAGGSVTNVTGGMIQGTSEGIYVSGAFSITNTGGIYGELASIELARNATGTVTNMTKGTLGSTKSDFGFEALGAGTITNNGQIISSIEAVYLRGGGLVTNMGGMINGIDSLGVHIVGGAGTVINAGIIDGGVTAVAFASGFDNLLQVMPGGAFSGQVNGGNTIGATHTSTLSLGSGSSAGTLTNLGVSIVNFGSVVFTPNDAWLVGGNTAGIAGGEVFGGFSVGDTIQITGVAGESISSYSNGTLSLTGGADLSVIFSAPEFTNFKVQNDPATPTATDITLLCYAEGTKILTPAGEVPIEDLREGDEVVTVLGAATAPVRWKGWRHVRPERHRRPETVQPILIRAGSFGERQPHTDLRVSPDHAIYIDGVLVPARLLVNGVTIVPEPVAEITYFHLELPAHDVILAHGLSCESYLNTGDRSAFENGGGAVALHPDFTAARWEGLACADLLLTGPRLSRIRASLAARARPRPVRSAA